MKGPETDVQLEDEVVQCGRVPRGLDYFEDFGQLILADADGQDILFWTVCYQIGGINPGRWIVENATVLNSTLIMVPSRERGAMHDNDFAHSGTSRQEYLKAGDFHLVKEKDRVTWQIEDWKHIARPPYWELKGSHAGIERDITISALGSAFWHKGPWENLSTEGLARRVAGFDQFCTASGSIKVGEKVLPLADGYSMHEHVVNGPGVDIISLLMRHSVYSVFGFTRDLQFFIFSMVGRSEGHLQVDGQIIAYDESSVALDVLDWWVDPRSKMRVPCRWHVNMCSPKGTLDIDMAASGRAYHLFTLDNGYWCPYWYVAFADGRFMFPNGRIMPIKDMRVGVQRGKTIVANKSTLSL